MKSLSFVSLAWVLVAQSASAQLIVNSPLPISEQVNVRIIVVANNDGSNPAPLFGTATQQASIFAKVDTIWAQAGIDVNFTFSSSNYLSTFALTGTAGSNNPRPTGDLNTIVSNAAAAGGILDPNPNTINLFMVRIVPGFSQTSNNTSNGLAFVGGNGIAFWAGPNLPGFSGGEDVIASVLAHEIGHNLGLSHISETENLMQSSGDGERLNSAQISTALASRFSVAVVPEPLLSPALFTIGVFVWRRRRPSRAL
jgi:hypothetical protein